MYVLPNTRARVLAAIERGVNNAFAQHGQQTAMGKDYSVGVPLKRGELVMIDGKPHRIISERPGAVPGSFNYEASPHLNRRERRTAGRE